MAWIQNPAKTIKTVLIVENDARASVRSGVLFLSPEADEIWGRVMGEESAPVLERRLVSSGW